MNYVLGNDATMIAAMLIKTQWRFDTVMSDLSTRELAVGWYGD